MTDVCWRCRKPILEGEARYTLGEFKDPPEFCHYDCKDADDKKLKTDLENFGKKVDAAQELLRRLRKDMGL